jgi:hypothetical protein
VEIRKHQILLHHRRAFFFPLMSSSKKRPAEGDHYSTNGGGSSNAKRLSRWGFHFVMDSNETVTALKSSIILPIIARGCLRHGIPATRGNLEAGDFFLVLDPDPAAGFPEEGVGLVVEFKGTSDALANASSHHDHFRSQINALHRGLKSVGGKFVFTMGPIEKQGKPAQLKALRTLKVRCLIEHANSVHIEHFETEEELMDFLIEAGRTLVERRAGTRVFDSVERVNISHKRIKPEVPWHYLQLHLEEVRGVGKTKAMAIAKKYGSVGALSRKFREHGPSFLHHEGILGGTLSSKVMLSLGLGEEEEDGDSEESSGEEDEK